MIGGCVVRVGMVSGCTGCVLWNGNDGVGNGMLLRYGMLRYGMVVFLCESPTCDTY